jgi:hypothetical protein
MVREVGGPLVFTAAIRGQLEPCLQNLKRGTPVPPVRSLDTGNLPKEPKISLHLGHSQGPGGKWGPLVSETPYASR